MKLLCITSHDDTFNSIRPEAEQMLAMASQELELTVMTQGDSLYKTAFEAAGIKLIDHVPEKKLSLHSIRVIRRLLKSEQFDAVYSFNNKAICNTNMAAIGLPLVVASYRGQTGNISRRDPSAYLTHLHPRLNAIICVAQAIKKDLQQHHYKPEIIDYAYKGHNLDWYPTGPSDLNEFGISEHDITVICVANHRPRKGLSSLIKAGADIKNERVHFLLVGGGLDDPDLQTLIKQSPMSARIHCAGHRKDVPALVAASQISVLPALRREGLSKSTIESMAYGVSTIVTNTGGNAELVLHEHNGLVVKPGDSAAIAQAINRLANDPILRDQYGQAGRQRIAEHFTVEAGAKRTIDALKRAIDRRKLS